jgi:hypothetical protein
MAKQVREYMDIGHADPRDVLWFFNRDTLEIETTSAARDQTHEKKWGMLECERTWRGRYEVTTGRVSIAPPLSGKISDRPPETLLRLLNEKFDVVRFYYFEGMPVSFSPNPKRH